MVVLVPDVERDPHLVGERAAQDHRMGKPRVGVRKRFFKPLPFIGGSVGIALRQFGGERVANLIGPAIAAEATQIFVDADQSESPCAR